MVSRLDPSSESFLAALNKVNDKAERASRQIATGYRITAPSDDPDMISTLLQTRAELAQITQIQSNLNRIQTEVDTAEQTLSDSVSLMDHVRSLGVQGASSTTSVETRTSLANEIDSILQRLVGMTSTQVSGRYLFSGDSDSTPPFTWDSAQPYPVSAYQGSAATRQVLDPSGITFPVSHNASQVYDAPGSSVFRALFDLSASLRANDEAGIKASILEVQNASNHLGRELAFYGCVQSQVNQAIETTSKRQLSLKTQVSSIQEVDLVESILELNQAKAHQQAALESRARLPRSSLFDYLG